MNDRDHMDEMQRKVNEALANWKGSADQLENAKLRAENERLRAALHFGRGAARLALAKASTSALNDFAVAALEAIETNADAALQQEKSDG